MPSKPKVDLSNLNEEFVLVVNGTPELAVWEIPNWHEALHSYLGWEPDTYIQSVTLLGKTSRHVYMHKGVECDVESLITARMLIG